MVLMANRSILPAAYRFQGELGADGGGGQGGRRAAPRSRARRSTR